MLRVVTTSIIVFFLSQFLITENGFIVPKKKEYIFYNVLSVFCLYSFFNIFIWQYEINLFLVAMIVYILSIAMYYVHEFRGTNLNFSDISSINTAKEVAGGYKYTIKPLFVIVFLLIIAEFLLLFLTGNLNIDKNYHKALNGVESLNIDRYRLFWHEIGQILSFFLSFFILKDKISKEQFDYSLAAGENEGYIYNFVSSIPAFHKSNINLSNSINIAKEFIFKCFTFERDKNEKYQSMAVYKKYADKEPDAPHIIVIMNESFGTLHRRIHTNVQVTPFFDNLEGSIKGNLYVNTFGGGTANTEFEFLTGMTIGNYPYPVMPYNNFVKRYKYSLARYFNNLGYKTIAMHPYTASNYHRDKVYRYFGFEELVFIKDLKTKSYVRNFVSDDSMYDEVIRKYKITKSQDKKMFLFGVTVQNHSGYDNFNGSKILSLTRNNKNRDAIDSYMTLMRISDDALHNLINYFEKEDDHIVVLFFGDHNASFGTDINKEYFDTNMDYAFSNAYVTPFFIYDNKYKEEKFIKSISANFLSLELLKKCNMPYDMLHHKLSELYKVYSAYSFHKAKKRSQNEIVDIPMDEFMNLEKEYLK